MTCNRFGNKWTINEGLSLQREYELLEMNVEEIALKHERSVMAIVYKLKAEGFINFIQDARGFPENKIDLIYSLQEDEESVYGHDDDDSTYIDDDSTYIDDDSTYIDDELDLDDEEEEETCLTTNVRISIMTTRIHSLETLVNELITQVAKLNDRTQNVVVEKENFINQYI
jgi:hypothetical protein